MRRAGVEVDVRQHRDVAVAHRLHRRRAHARQVRRRGVAMQVLRVLLVEVHEHRPLLARLVVVGNRQNALQLVAVLVLEVEQDAVAPEILGLLRIRVADLLRVLEAGARHAQVGELGERLTREEVLVGLRRLHRIAERRVLVDELLQLAVGQLVEAGLLRRTRRTPRASPASTRSIVARAAARVRRVHRRRRHPAPPRRRRSPARVADVAETDLALGADAVRQVASAPSRRAAASHRS